MIEIYLLTIAVWTIVAAFIGTFALMIWSICTATANPDRKGTRSTDKEAGRVSDQKKWHSASLKAKPVKPEIVGFINNVRYPINY